MGNTASGSASSRGAAFKEMDDTVASIEFASREQQLAFEKLVGESQLLPEDAALQVLLNQTPSLLFLSTAQIHKLVHVYGRNVAANAFKSGNFQVLCRLVAKWLPQVLTLECPSGAIVAAATAAAVNSSISGANAEFPLTKEEKQKILESAQVESSSALLNKCLNALFLVKQFVLLFVQHQKQITLLDQFNRVPSIQVEWHMAAGADGGATGSMSGDSRAREPFVSSGVSKQQGGNDRVHSASSLKLSHEHGAQHPASSRTASFGSLRITTSPTPSDPSPNGTTAARVSASTSSLTASSPLTKTTDLAFRFLNVLVNALADFEPTPSTYALHVEIVNTILVLLSTTMFQAMESPTPNHGRESRTKASPNHHQQPEPNPFFEMLLRQGSLRDDDHTKTDTNNWAKPLVHRLLKNFIEQKALPVSLRNVNMELISAQQLQEMNLSLLDPKHIQLRQQQRQILRTQPPLSPPQQRRQMTTTVGQKKADSFLSFEGIGSVASSLLYFPIQFYRLLMPQKDSQVTLLADRSMLLLIALLRAPNARRRRKRPCCQQHEIESRRQISPARPMNPFVTAFDEIIDNMLVVEPLSPRPTTVLITTPGSSWHSRSLPKPGSPPSMGITNASVLTIGKLLEAIEKKMAFETSHMLLYSLVCEHADFLSWLLCKPSHFTLLQDQICIPLLRMVYFSPACSPGCSSGTGSRSEQMYLAFISLLQCTSHPHFVQFAHRATPAAQLLDWFHPVRAIQGISLGSLMVLVLLRAWQHNLLETQDLFLHELVLASLWNVVTKLELLHALSAQTLMKEIEFLVKGMQKMQTSLEMTMAVASRPEEQEIKVATLQRRACYEENLALLLDMLCACLENKHLLPRNPQLIYALLHKADVFEVLARHASFKRQLRSSGIAATISHFRRVLGTYTTEDEVLDVELVLHCIQRECNRLAASEEDVISLMILSTTTTRPARVSTVTGSLQEEGEADQSHGQPLQLRLGSAASLEGIGSVCDSTTMTNNDNSNSVGAVPVFGFAESDQADLFFVPCVWRLVYLSTLDFGWPKEDTFLLF